MRAKKALSSAVLALGVVVAPLFISAGTAQAAPGSDLDLTNCSLFDEQIDWGDGIDWYVLNYTITNEGSAATGDFSWRESDVYGKDKITGLTQNHAIVERKHASLAPGQTSSGAAYVTKKTVDDRTWGVFADVYKQTGESQTSDSFCSAHVNNT